LQQIIEKSANAMDLITKYMQSGYGHAQEIAYLLNWDDFRSKCVASVIHKRIYNHGGYGQWSERCCLKQFGVDRNKNKYRETLLTTSNK
jgi:hypothetical protein